MTKRSNVKPNAADRLRRVLGALLALGAEHPIWRAPCPLCGASMTLAQLAGEGERTATLYHTVSFADCRDYAQERVRVACNVCNETHHTSPVDASDPRWNVYPATLTAPGTLVRQVARLWRPDPLT